MPRRPVHQHTPLLVLGLLLLVFFALMLASLLTLAHADTSVVHLFLYCAVVLATLAVIGAAGQTPSNLLKIVRGWFL